MSAAPWSLVHTPQLPVPVPLPVMPPARPCVSAIGHQPSAISPQPSESHTVSGVCSQPVRTSQLASRIASHHPAASLHHLPCPPSGFDRLFARAVQPEPDSGSRRPLPDQKSQFPSRPAEWDPRAGRGRGRDKTTAKGRPSARANHTSPAHSSGQPAQPAQPGLV